LHGAEKKRKHASAAKIERALQGRSRSFPSQDETSERGELKRGGGLNTPTKKRGEAFKRL